MIVSTVVTSKIQLSGQYARSRTSRARAREFEFRQYVQRAGPSIFLPYLPMLPIQVLTNNLLYDFSQTAIPTDNVDEDSP